MDMVRDCMRDAIPFGVCLITSSRGKDTDVAPATAHVGCLARIVAWDMQQLGVLQIRTIGGERFNLLASESQPNGLLIGEIDPIEPDDDQPIAAEHRPCVDLLRRIIDDVSAQTAEKRRTDDLSDTDPTLVQTPFEPPYLLDSSAWVSNRLCEVLPVPMKAKQKLMELTDAATRLDIVHTYLKQHSVLK